jgi:endonuclease-3
MTQTKRFDIRKVWPLLGRQVRSLRVPWLETMASRKRDPFRILVSCLLSLRTQDRTTGEASERLYRLASTPEEMAKLPVREIERAIYPVGFYRVKAKRIRAIGREIAEKYASRVPDEIDELLKLKGVGRKTANLVVTLGYDKLGICVDTHVHRITNRWGYIKTKTPEKTEFALREKLPQEYWKEINGLLVAFGQSVCKPISPSCSQCDLNSFCPKVGVTMHR